MDSNKYRNYELVADPCQHFVIFSFLFLFSLVILLFWLLSLHFYFPLNLLNLLSWNLFLGFISCRAFLQHQTRVASLEIRNLSPHVSPFPSQENPLHSPNERQSKKKTTTKFSSRTEKVGYEIQFKTS